MLWKGREDDDEGEHERERRDEWYGLWPSEEESGVEGEAVKPVYAELAVPLSTMLNCEACERRLDERL